MHSGFTKSHWHCSRLRKVAVEVIDMQMLARDQIKERLAVHHALDEPGCFNELLPTHGACDFVLVCSARIKLGNVSK
jgi:hypothetical protein